MAALLCKLLGHRRSRRDARRIGDRWISYCRLCGSMMVRDAPNRWSAVGCVDGVPAEPWQEADAG